MPSAYAHLRFGWEVLSAIPAPYRAAAKNLTQLYNVGTQGPDPLFYYNPLVENPVDKQGHHCHAMTGKAFFEAALVRYRAAPSEGAAAYLFGVLAHYCLDSHCHPLINASTEEADLDHMELETEFDRFLLQKDGKLPQIAPYGGVDFYMSFMDGSVGWSDVGVLIPYRFWKLYGDDCLIRRHYDGMVRYAKFMIKRCAKFTPLRHHLPLKGEAKKYIVNYGQSYGEWAEPEDVFPNDWKNTVLPHPEESTAYTVFIMNHMIEIAEYFGKQQDKALFEKYRDGCTKAYRELITLPGYTLDTDRQAKLVRPLYMHLLDKKQEAYAKHRLIQAMENYRWRLGTGFLSTPFILDVLADIDIEYAYRLLENEEMPGWLFMPKNGATTIWESWEGTKAQGGIASLNHYSKGAVCEWLFKTMCGIRVDEKNHFTIAPRPGGHFTHANAVYNSVYGRVESGWKKQSAGYVFTVRIPCNTTAEIVLPNGSRKQVSAGEYQFTEEDLYETE